MVLHSHQLGLLPCRLMPVLVASPLLLHLHELCLEPLQQRVRLLSSSLEALATFCLLAELAVVRIAKHHASLIGLFLQAFLTLVCEAGEGDGLVVLHFATLDLREQCGTVLLDCRLQLVPEAVLLSLRREGLVLKSLCLHTSGRGAKAPQLLPWQCSVSRRLAAAVRNSAGYGSGSARLCTGCGHLGRQLGVLVKALLAMTAGGVQGRSYEELFGPLLCKPGLPILVRLAGSAEQAVKLLTELICTSRFNLGRSCLDTPSNLLSDSVSQLRLKLVVGRLLCQLALVADYFKLSLN
mmetsp:Transcript_17617/g.38604  ORF Transcript_17617/g.38604 Transcript_17617/m.38604 type:complete len:295 (-) Transcript_17617:939-1823(-)